jgi:hypothetical protein
VFHAGPLFGDRFRADHCGPILGACHWRRAIVVILDIGSIVTPIPFKESIGKTSTSFVLAHCAALIDHSNGR